ncbi:MAG: hypothetical protein ABJA71_12200 [Ginsengibacter sp.]
MRSVILFIICLPLLTPSSFAQKKVNRQYFINLLNAGEYDKVFDTATKLRKQVYGKNAVIDYFIAKSLCLDGYKEKSTYCFNCIIRNFKLSGGKKDFIQQEINTCNTPANREEEVLVTNPDFSYINNVSLPEAGVSGKMGRVYNCFSKEQTINLNSMVSPDELESRLFSINQKKNAIQKIKSVVNNNYKIDTSGRYVFVTSKNSSLDSVSYAAERLEQAYMFFVNYYGLRAPDKLLTVYILPDQIALRQTAKLVHGIQLPDPNIGYSNLSDLGLLGLGDSKHLGTMYHELFHLIIRTDLGDIPAFLDEGLASLYSVSRWDDKKLIGDHRSWRLDELKEARYATDKFLKIPPLDKLINYSWDEFDGQETKNVCQVAVNYALSNFVMIYLQEKNLLQQMVTAFKNRPFVPLDTAKSKSNVQLFAEVVNDSIKKFASKFDLWFKDRYNFDLYKEASSSTSTPVNMPQLFDNVRILLLETNEKVFKFNEPEKFKQLDEELKAIQNDYDKIPKDYNNAVLNSNAILNSNVNAVQQSSPVDSASTKRNEIRTRLDEYEKNLRKIIFDKMPKTAN